MVYLKYDDLVKIVKQLVPEVIQTLQNDHDEEKFITRKQTANFLSISLSTVDEWSRKKIIKKHYLKNGSVRFDKEELITLIKK